MLQIFLQNIFERKVNDMDSNFERAEKFDDIAGKAGGYCEIPSAQDIEYMTLFLELCNKYKISYGSATPQQKAFIEEVTRVAWERRMGKKDVRPSFSA